VRIDPDRALPIRRFPVSRLRLRQARDLWVLNRNELKIKGLVDGECRDRSGQAWSLSPSYRLLSYLEPSISASLSDCRRLARGTQPTDGRSACRASGLLEIAFPQPILAIDASFS
jgi:hypothetical protein